MAFEQDQLLDRILSTCYLLHDAGNRDAFSATPIDPYLELSAVLVNGEVDRQVAVPFIQRPDFGGKKLYDVIFTGWAATKLVSDRVVRSLQDAGLSGWSTFPISLSRTGNEEVQGYSGLAINGRAGALEDDKCPVTEEASEWTNKMIPVRKGFYFDPRSWDGSDFFFPSGTTLLIATDRVKQLFEKEGFNNVMFERLSDVRRVIPKKKISTT